MADAIGFGQVVSFSSDQNLVEVARASSRQNLTFGYSFDLKCGYFFKQEWQEVALQGGLQRLNIDQRFDQNSDRTKMPCNLKYFSFWLSLPVGKWLCRTA